MSQMSEYKPVAVGLDTCNFVNACDFGFSVLAARHATGVV